MDPGIGHQVGLELIQIHVESSVKAKAGRDRRDNLRYQTVEVCVGGTLDTQIPEVQIRCMSLQEIMATPPLADVIDGLVVHHEGTVRVLQGGVGAQGGVVGLHHGRGHLMKR